MTGPEHYREAQTHLECAQAATTKRGEQYHLRKAQVHATLAQAAATAEQYAERWSGDHLLDRAWSEAIS